MPTLVKVTKWDKGLALLIPSRFAKRRRINVGSVVDLESLKIAKSPRITLAELMAKFKPEHCHPEWDLGCPKGKEPW